VHAFTHTRAGGTAKTANGYPVGGGDAQWQGGGKKNKKKPSSTTVKPPASLADSTASTASFATAGVHTMPSPPLLQMNGGAKLPPPQLLNGATLAVEPPAPLPQRARSNLHEQPTAPQHNGTAVKKPTPAPPASPPYPQRAPVADERVSRYSVSSDLADPMTDPVAKRKAIAREEKNLAKHDAVIEHVRERFTHECTAAEARMRRAFGELRTLLDQREASVEQQLRQVSLQVPVSMRACTHTRAG